MHFEVLVEDASGRLLLDAVLPKILGPDGDEHTWRTIAYKGVGKLPAGLKPGSDARHRILLDQLPRLLAGYGKSLHHQEAAVVLVVDQDDKPCLELKAKLVAVLESCHPRPTALFRIAVEEMEAWLLGDRAAVEQVYPKAKAQILDKYVQDSVCGTWEVLADAIHPGGRQGAEAGRTPGPSEVSPRDSDGPAQGMTSC